MMLEFDYYDLRPGEFAFYVGGNGQPAAGAIARLLRRFETLPLAGIHFQGIDIEIVTLQSGSMLGRFKGNFKQHPQMHKIDDSKIAKEYGDLRAATQEAMADARDEEIDTALASPRPWSAAIRDRFLTAILVMSIVAAMRRDGESDEARIAAELLDTQMAHQIEFRTADQYWVIGQDDVAGYATHIGRRVRLKDEDEDEDAWHGPLHADEERTANAVYRRTHPRHVRAVGRIMGDRETYRFFPESAPDLPRSLLFIPPEGDLPIDGARYVAMGRVIPTYPGEIFIASQLKEADDILLEETIFDGRSAPGPGFRENDEDAEIDFPRSAHFPSGSDIPPPSNIQLWRRQRTSRTGVFVDGGDVWTLDVDEGPYSGRPLAVLLPAETEIIGGIRYEVEGSLLTSDGTMPLMVAETVRQANPQIRL